MISVYYCVTGDRHNPQPEDENKRRAQTQERGEAPTIPLFALDGFAWVHCPLSLNSNSTTSLPYNSYIVMLPGSARSTVEKDQAACRIETTLAGGSLSRRVQHR